MRRFPLWFGLGLGDTTFFSPRASEQLGKPTLHPTKFFLLYFCDFPFPASRFFFPPDSSSIIILDFFFQQPDVELFVLDDSPPRFFLPLESGFLPYQILGTLAPLLNPVIRGPTPETDPPPLQVSIAFRGHFSLISYQYTPTIHDPPIIDVTRHFLSNWEATFSSPISCGKNSFAFLLSKYLRCS